MLYVFICAVLVLVHTTGCIISTCEQWNNVWFDLCFSLPEWSTTSQAHRKGKPLKKMIFQISLLNLYGSFSWHLISYLHQITACTNFMWVLRVHLHLSKNNTVLHHTMIIMLLLVEVVFLSYQDDPSTWAASCVMIILMTHPHQCTGGPWTAHSIRCHLSRGNVQPACSLQGCHTKAASAEFIVHLNHQPCKTDLLRKTHWGALQTVHIPTN